MTDGKNFLIKEIHVNPKGILSLQKHFHRSEHWVVTQGKPKITLNKKLFSRKSSETIFIPQGAIHRIQNPNKKTVKITNTKKHKQFASYSIVKTMRAGILVLGPLVAKYHKSISSFPGGCVLNGNSGRPINLHLEALKKIGMKYEIKKGYILSLIHI